METSSFCGVANQRAVQRLCIFDTDLPTELNLIDVNVGSVLDGTLAKTFRRKILSIGATINSRL